MASAFWELDSEIPKPVKKKNTAGTQAPAVAKAQQTAQRAVQATRPTLPGIPAAPDVQALLRQVRR